MSAASSSCRPSPPPPTPGPMPPPGPPASPPPLIILDLTPCRLTAPTARAAGKIRRVRLAKIANKKGRSGAHRGRTPAGGDLEAAIGVTDDDSSSRPATGRLDPLVTRGGSPNKRRGEGRRRRGRGRALARVWPWRGSRAGAAAGRWHSVKPAAPRRRKDGAHGEGWSAQRWERRGTT